MEEKKVPRKLTKADIAKICLDHLSAKGENDCLSSYDMPGCCTMKVLTTFTEDDVVERHTEDINEDRREDGLFKRITLTDMHATFIKNLTEKLIDSIKIEQGPGGILLTLSAKQALCQKAAMNAGFKKVGRYQGHEGVITVFLHTK